MIAPSEVKRVATEQEKENWRFAVYLKDHVDPEELDRQFYELHQELFAQYDCCYCNNCCTSYYISIHEEDIAPLVTFFQTTREEFVKGHFVAAEEGYDIPPPCPFLLRDGKCFVQEIKPRVCRAFPFTDQPGQLDNFFGVIELAVVCPIVFEIIQRLRQIYHYEATN
ncbi:MAG: YkgJ family cysteine cluster protein [Symbiobacteriaceae bacterium]|nr:YkgJ family cysteine cluster protein [Symbiobacteriaceae bacterium]